MADIWTARFKNISGNYTTLASINIQIEYYVAGKQKNFFENFDLSVVDNDVIDNNLEEIRFRVISKVVALNEFEEKIEKLMFLIGRDINVGKAVRLVLGAEAPILK